MLFNIHHVLRSFVCQPNEAAYTALLRDSLHTHIHKHTHARNTNMGMIRAESTLVLILWCLSFQNHLPDCLSMCLLRFSISSETHLVCCHITYLLSSPCIQAIFMIPTRPPPTLSNPKKFSKEFIDFIARCLVKEPNKRPTAAELLEVSIS